jgi:hypothetical protein
VRISTALFMAPWYAVTSPTPELGGLLTWYRQAFAFSYALHNPRSYSFIGFRCSSAYESYFLSIIAIFLSVTIHRELRFQQKSVDQPSVITPWPQKRNNSDLQAYELSSLKINFPPLLYFGAAEFLDYNRSCLYRVFIIIQFIFRLPFTRLTLWHLTTYIWVVPHR